MKEIIAVRPITRVPGLPSHLKGVTNLRGQIIPIVDLGERLGVEDRDYDERSAIIIVETTGQKGSVSFTDDC